MFARVIHRRPLDHAHQHRNLLRRQLVERTVEIEIAGQAKAMNRAALFLAKIDFIQIGFKNFILVVVPLQQ